MWIGDHQLHWWRVLMGVAAAAVAFVLGSRRPKSPPKSPRQ